MAAETGGGGLHDSVEAEIDQAAELLGSRVMNSIQGYIYCTSLDAILLLTAYSFSNFSLTL